MNDLQNGINGQVNERAWESKVITPERLEWLAKNDPISFDVMSELVEKLSDPATDTTGLEQWAHDEIARRKTARKQKALSGLPRELKHIEDIVTKTFYRERGVLNHLAEYGEIMHRDTLSYPKPVKGDKRPYADDLTISVLYEAKLVKPIRDETYYSPDTTVSAWGITAKGKKWYEFAQEAHRKEGLKKREQMAKTMPEEYARILNKEAQLARFNELPFGGKQAVEMVLKITEQSQKWAWMSKPVEQRWMQLKPSLYEVLLLGYLNTLSDEHAKNIFYVLDGNLPDMITELGKADNDRKTLLKDFRQLNPDQQEDLLSELRKEAEAKAAAYEPPEYMLLQIAMPFALQTIRSIVSWTDIWNDKITFDDILRNFMLITPKVLNEIDWVALIEFINHQTTAGGQWVRINN
ncbi:MAG: hypothetical protein H0X30_22725 [Anaerolineae bacterium]|nr:hypothetical protein [Anaerolineae bacterium]